MQKRFAFPPHQSLRDSFPSRGSLSGQKLSTAISIKITVLIWRRWRDSPAFLFSLREREKRNQGIRQCLHWLMHMPYGMCGHDSNLSIHFSPKQKTRRRAGFSFWRRWRDSNSRGAFDPYTISNRARSTNYATSPCCSRTRLFNCQPAHYNAASRQSQGIFSRFSKRIVTAGWTGGGRP